MESIEDNKPPKVKLTREQKEILSKTVSWVERFFVEEEKNNRLVMGGHGLDHNQRVAGMASVLSIMEKKDPFLPVITSLLIDIGRTSSDPNALSYQHGKLSKEMASDFVNKLSLLTKEDKEIVLNAIEDHPLYNKDVRRGYVVEIVMDSDRLDSIGALGPVRAAATRWKLPLYTIETEISHEESEIKSIYQDFAFRVSRWFDSLWTESARKIAYPRVKFLNSFIKEYRKEASFMTKAYQNLGIR